MDGDIHNFQHEEDSLREKALRELGLKIVRFKNDDVVKKLPHVVEQIRVVVSKRQA